MKSAIQTSYLHYSGLVLQNHFPALLPDAPSEPSVPAELPAPSTESGVVSQGRADLTLVSVPCCSCPAVPTEGLSLGTQEHCKALGGILERKVLQEGKQPACLLHWLLQAFFKWGVTFAVQVLFGKNMVRAVLKILHYFH